MINRNYSDAYADMEDMRERIIDGNRDRVRKCAECGAPVLLLKEITRKKLKTKIKVTEKLVPVTVGRDPGCCRIWHRTFKGVHGRLNHRKHSCGEYLGKQERT